MIGYHNHACRCSACRPRHVSERRRLSAGTEGMIIVLGFALALLLRGCAA